MPGERPQSDSVGDRYTGAASPALQVDGWMTVAEAAAELGVRSDHVRELARSGVLSAAKPTPNTVLVSRDSVRRRRAAAPPPGRPLSGRNAWAMLWIAGGRAPSWVSPNELIRVRKYSRRPLRQWSAMLARRAQVHHVRAPEFIANRISRLEEVGVGGTDAAIAHGASLMRSDQHRRWEFYLTAMALNEVRDMRGVGWDSNAPNLVLRELPHELPGDVIQVLTGDDVVPREVAAADLLDEGDERTSRVAAELLHLNDDRSSLA